MPIAALLSKWIRPRQRGGILNNPRPYRGGTVSRGVFPPPTGRQGKSVGNPESLCLILPYSPRTTRILRSLFNGTRPLSSPRCHRRLTLLCLSPKPSVSAHVSSGPFPGHACRRSASFLDQKQKTLLGQTSTALGLVGGTTTVTSLRGPCDSS